MWKGRPRAPRVDSFLGTILGRSHAGCPLCWPHTWGIPHTIVRRTPLRTSLGTAARIGDTWPVFVARVMAGFDGVATAECSRPAQ